VFRLFNRRAITLVMAEYLAADTAPPVEAGNE